MFPPTISRSAAHSVYRQAHPRAARSFAPRRCAECANNRSFSRTIRVGTAASRRDDSSSSSQKKPLRLYRYFVDVHGQLFLHDTVPKNLTSCFKNPDFLDFFFTRLRPNEYPGAPADEASQLEDDWTDVKAGKLTEEEACRFARAQGYQWISPCMGELNFIRAEDAPIVYKDISQEGELRWAGTRTEPFDPTQLYVHPSTGRLYTLSPSLGKKGRQPFGEYSLLSSAFVLQHLASDLQIEDELRVGQDAGTVRWKGKEYRLRGLDPSVLRQV